MSDLIQLGIGERPWLPTPRTESIEIFDRYDMPTAGLIKQDGTLFVFDCLEGHVTEGNLWIYACVDAVEATRLRDAQGEEFTKLFDSVFTSRSIMVAVAIDGRLRSGVSVDAHTIAREGLTRAVTRS